MNGDRTHFGFIEVAGGQQMPHIIDNIAPGENEQVTFYYMLEA